MNSHRFAFLASIASGLLSMLSAADSSATPTPATKSIPFSEIGAKATADCKGNAIGMTATAEGATLHTGFQKLAGMVTREGLRLSSTEAAGGSLQLKAGAVGRVGGAMQPLVATGCVTSTDSLVSFTRPGLTEEYSVSADGVRQDFIVATAPPGRGALSVELALSGATAEAAADGARLTLAGSRRELAYSRLKVTDARGQVLSATLAVLSPERLAVHVDDAGAAYPVRIDPTFSDADWMSLNPGIPGADNGVNAAVVDGSGNLYIGGDFTVVGTVKANRIAKWDGSAWSALGSGMDGEVNALAVSGSNLYVGGIFSNAGGTSANRIAKWNGTAWSALGAGMNGGVLALAVSGSDLYAGGWFSTAGGISAIRIAKWNGGSWSALGAGANSDVYALAVSGSDLYAGGAFTTAGGTTVNGIAKWNGSAWSALGTGMNGGVHALAVSGSNLYAGGNFTTAGSTAAASIAKWNGSAWSALGTGVAGISPIVYALAVSGTDLYAGGEFGTAGGTTVSAIAKWDGSAWSGLSTGMGGSVLALAVSGTDLYSGGTFSTAGDTGAIRIAKWSGSAWSALGIGMNGAVNALVVSGSDLYAGGFFTMAGSTAANFIAKWDGSAWSALGSGMNASVHALVMNGGDLYAGGYFTTAGGVSANRIAKWNGSVWSALGTGMDGGVQAVAVIGTDLYAGGVFTTAGGTTCNHIAKWDGSAWSALGSGMENQVNALAVSGSDLYAGGSFTTAGGTSCSSIAKWNGSAWSALGAGMNNPVTSLAVSGSHLYAGGYFTTAGGVAGINRVAKWDGSAWSALGSGTDAGVLALAMSGSELYAGGLFTTAGGQTVNRIAKWTGGAWLPRGSGVSASVNALAVDGTGHFFVGGSFSLAGTTLSPFVAEAATVADSSKIEVTGNGVPISNGDGTPDRADHTDFGTVPLLNQRVTRRFTLSNSGDWPLNLTANVAITGAAAGDFAVTEFPTSPVAVGGSSTFEVTFDPRSPGLRTATVSIANDSATPVFTFAISGTGALAVRRAQSIAFSPPATAYLVQNPLALNATASSGLPVTLSLVSGPATLLGNSLTLTGPGTVKVTATQAGDSTYAAATAVTRSIVVKATPTTLTLLDLAQVYDGTPKPISIVGGISPVITYKIGTTYGSIAPTNAGSYAVKVVDGAVTKPSTLVIAKAVLTVSPDDQRKFVGQANPALTSRISGYRGTDTSAVVTKAPVLATTATLASVGGVYPISASGAAALNYSFSYQPGTLVVESFAGSYEALLVDGSSTFVGKLSITVPVTGKTFTAKLASAATTSAVAFAGPLVTGSEQATGADTTTVVINKVGTPYGISFTLPLYGNVTASATRSGFALGSASDGQKLSTATVLYAGAHTVVLEPASGGVPEGAGWATASISTKGVITLSGKLGDATAFTATVSPDGLSNPGYRVFVQPYLAARTDSFLAGPFSLTPHPTLTNRRYVAAADMTWKKAGLPADASYRSGFGPATAVLMLDPWLSPVAATKTAPAITLPQRLGLTVPNFAVAHTNTNSAANINLPTRLALSATNAVSAQTPAANLTKWKTLTFLTSNGTFTGTFELVDGLVKRPVTFSGVLRQPATNTDPLIGDGHYLLPPLSGTEKSTGEMNFQRP